MAKHLLGQSTRRNKVKSHLQFRHGTRLAWDMFNFVESVGNLNMLRCTNPFAHATWHGFCATQKKCQSEIYVLDFFWLQKNGQDIFSLGILSHLEKFRNEPAWSCRENFPTGLPLHALKLARKPLLIRLCRFFGSASRFRPIRRLSNCPKARWNAALQRPCWGCKRALQWRNWPIDRLDVCSPRSMHATSMELARGICGHSNLAWILLYACACYL